VWPAWSPNFLFHVGNTILINSSFCVLISCGQHGTQILSELPAPHKIMIRPVLTY